MSRAAVIFFLLLCLSPLWTWAESCEKYLQAFTTYDELVEGKVVDKFSVFEITDWSKDSDYEGWLATSALPANADVQLQVKVKKKARPFQKLIFSKAWNLDSKYKVADQDPKKLLPSDQVGSYTLSIKSEGKVLCEQSFEILPPH